MSGDRVDSLLLIGNTDEKLGKALDKLGYKVHNSEGQEALASLVANELVDVIVVDSRAKLDCPTLCHLLRGEEATKKTPIVYLSKSKDDTGLIQKMALDRLEIVEVPYSLGGILSCIATQVRLRKLIGASANYKPTISEMNASLRDINGKFKKDLDDARKIQMGLLPKKLPKNEFFEVAAYYIPLEEVGGDWYFVEKRSEDKYFAFIADVTGHGLPAAFIGSMTKLAYRAANLDNPGECLTRINALMAPELPSGRFLTMCAILYDPSTGKLSFSRAAHPPGFWINRTENRVIQLETDGYAIGFFDDSQYVNKEVQLGINDCVVMLTDGILEAQNRDAKLYGNDGLAKVLITTKPEDSADEIIKLVMKDFDEFRDGRICKDDITLVVLKRFK